MPTQSPTYGSLVTHTITITGLASDTTLLVGREGTAIDQKDTDDADDALVGGQIAFTSPTLQTGVSIFAYASYDDTNFTGGCTGTDSARTVTDSNKATMRLICNVWAFSGSSKWGPFSLNKLFQGVIPVRWGIWLVHAAGVAADSGDVKHFPVKIGSV